MKKSILIFLLFLSSLPLLSQEELKKEELYIYVSNISFQSSVLSYEAYFGLESQEEDFNHDTYFFKISFPDLEHHTLFGLGKTIEKKSINYIEPISYFKNKSFCYMHLELSRYKRIFIVTDFPNTHKEGGKSYKDKFVIFYSRYNGSIKDISFMNMTNKNLINL
ncbi:hypothetical protein [Lacinutrix jangbogonensis]|uniref:hypothetical protein n=1 Tax=Lacinutrix jangbogonensis TaxID=1469557 RepID=UPI00053D053C|nr:hypothetical protein [Lacinutrix jangbogonensis]